MLIEPFCSVPSIFFDVSDSTRSSRPSSNKVWSPEGSTPSCATSPDAAVEHVRLLKRLTALAALDQVPHHQALVASRRHHLTLAREHQRRDARAVAPFTLPSSAPSDVSHRQMARSSPPVTQRVPSALKATALIAPVCRPLRKSSLVLRLSRSNRRARPVAVAVSNRFFAALGEVQATARTMARWSSRWCSCQRSDPGMRTQMRTVPSSLPETIFGSRSRLTATQVTSCKWPDRAASGGVTRLASICTSTNLSASASIFTASGGTAWRWEYAADRRAPAFARRSRARFSRSRSGNASCSSSCASTRSRSGFWICKTTGSCTLTISPCCLYMFLITPSIDARRMCMLSVVCAPDNSRCACRTAERFDTSSCL